MPKKRASNPATRMEPARRRGPLRKGIRAHVLLRGPEGRTLGAGQVTAESIGQYVSTPAVRERVRQFLESHGFSIESVGPFSIAVDGTPAVYEKVFGCRPQRGSTGAEWEWFREPCVPSELRDEVASVVLPQPASFMR